MEFIRCEHLSHVYNKGMDNELQALIDINLTVKRGEFLTILGTNGSGKSTLAKHFNGLLLPSEGKCWVEAMDTADAEKTWEIRQQIGMVFQNPDNQIIAAIVEDDVAFGPENIGMQPSVIKEQVTAALKAVNMKQFRKFSPHKLSGGQKQRIAIAGALAMNTHCLVLDEPTAMLDPQGRLEVMNAVKELNVQHGITVINITHFMDEAAMSDRVIVMDQGRIIRQGTPREIFADVRGMKGLGLDVPVAAEIAWRLREKGVKLPRDIMTAEDLVKALCQ